MNPTDPFSTATSTATAEPSTSLRREPVAFDNVAVDPEFFEAVVFKSCEAKRQYVEGATFDRNTEKPVKLNAQGVPIWSVSVMAVTAAAGGRKKRQGDFKVSVASMDDPSDIYTMGDRVQLVGARFGVTGVKRRDSNDFVTWFTADEIVYAGAPAAKALAG